mgnify:FL=1
MNRIIKIGLDVHTTNYTICIEEPLLGGEKNVYVQTQIKPELKLLINVIDTFKAKFKDEQLDITLGYEAGCLGYSLYKDLKAKGYNCIILAPTTMRTLKGGKKIKNDYRDAKEIADCLCDGGFSTVYVPSVEDNAIKEYIRMRDDVKQNLKSIKQQIIALCTRNGFNYGGNSYWTNRHISFLSKIVFEDELLKETLDEYMAEYNHLTDRIDVFDRRIEELANKEIYVERVNRLKCFSGIKTHTALSLIVETSDFKRFAKGSDYGAWLGMIPIQDASSNKDNRFGITKSGNSHLRRLLTEASQAFTRGTVGHKSRDLKSRQAKCSSEVVNYADKANIRLKRKYYKMIQRGKKANVAKVAVARELACFVWGMMTDNIEVNIAK